MDQLQKFFIALLGMVFLVIVYSLVGPLFEHKHFHYIHQTGVGILIGTAFGAILYYLNDFSQFQFNEQLFFLALLPPMIFSGGYNLKKKQFFKNIKYILIFGLIGTLVSFFVIFGLTFLINQLELISVIGKAQTAVLSTALMIKFSATISATDSVAALTLIKPQDHPKLFSVIFGEGMVNDAVAIILFKVVGSVFQQTVHIAENLKEQGLDFHKVLLILWQFLYTVVASLAIGVVIGLISTWLFKKCRFLKSPVCQVVVVYLFGIFSYLVAEITQMSGVLAVLVAGITLAHFNFYNLSLTGQVATGVTYHAIAFIAQAVVFIYLGLSFMYYLTEYEISLSFFGLELLVCVISRFISIFGLALIFKLFSKWALKNSQMAIVSTAGTIRGSVAFALILTVQVPQHADEQQRIAIQVIKSTVLFMVFLTTILLGGAMPFFIKIFLGGSNKHDNQNQLKKSLFQQVQEELIKNEEDEKPQKPKGFFKMFDEVYLKPLLIYDYENRKDEIKKWKKMFKLNSPQYKGAQFSQIMQTNIRATLLQGMQHQRRTIRATMKNQSLMSSSNFIEKSLAR